MSAKAETLVQEVAPVQATHDLNATEMLARGLRAYCTRVTASNYTMAGRAAMLERLLEAHNCITQQQAQQASQQKQGMLSTKIWEIFQTRASPTPTIALTNEQVHRDHRDNATLLGEALSALDAHRARGDCRAAAGALLKIEGMIHSQNQLVNELHGPANRRQGRGLHMAVGTTHQAMPAGVVLQAQLDMLEAARLQDVQLAMLAKSAVTFLAQTSHIAHQQQQSCKRLEQALSESCLMVESEEGHLVGRHMLLRQQQSLLDEEVDLSVQFFTYNWLRVLSLEQLARLQAARPDVLPIGDGILIAQLLQKKLALSLTRPLQFPPSTQSTRLALPPTAATAFAASGTPSGVASGAASGETLAEVGLEAASAAHIKSAFLPYKAVSAQAYAQALPRIHAFRAITSREAT